MALDKSLSHAKDVCTDVVDNAYCADLLCIAEAGRAHQGRDVRGLSLCYQQRQLVQKGRHIHLQAAWSGKQHMLEEQMHLQTQTLTSKVRGVLTASRMKAKATHA